MINLDIFVTDFPIIKICTLADQSSIHVVLCIFTDVYESTQW